MTRNLQKPESGDSTMEMIPVKLHLAHSARGRVRFRTANNLSRDALSDLVSRIARLSGITRVVARPNTGSVIVEMNDESGQLAHRLMEAGIAEVLPHTPPPPLAQLAMLGKLRLDAAIGKGTDGVFDVRTALAAILILIALRQFAAGKIAGPATTLLMSAYALLDRTGGK